MCHVVKSHHAQCNAPKTKAKAKAQKANNALVICGEEMM
jgi:hypothetical protein